MSAAPTLKLRFQLGARTPFAIKRRLRRVPLALADVLNGCDAALPPLDAADDGYFVTSLPEQSIKRLTRRHGALRPFVYQRYARRYADLSIGFEAYLAGFSAKTRSTLKRKSRRFAELGGGTLDVRCYCSPSELAEFHGLARQVSRLTYQERLLDAGLPEDPAFIAEMTRLASNDRVRAWILFLDSRPVSYLYTPAEGETLIYAYLGHDPAFIQHSPGTVLQLEVMRQLMTERRFRLLDFTEGDGQHKRQFATGAVDCVDLLLLRPKLSNRLTMAALDSFNGAVSLAKAVLRGPVGRKLVNRLKA
ncbi:MAG: GNAT family N-acetyltransferase [Novosphingobium sp.]|nr:GNAT family N-acetyltransferase [Novosphingobium sp.]